MLVHGYNFTESSWETILGAVEGVDLPDLSEENEVRTSLEFNLTQLLDSRDYDYVFVEWVVEKGESVHLGHNRGLPYHLGCSIDRGNCGGSQIQIRYQW